MRTKYIALAVGLLVAGTALAFGLNSRPQANNGTTTEPAVVETDNCCFTGDCCCPGQGSCCDPAAKEKAATSAVKYVKNAGAGCCATGNCCCPGQGSCCGALAAAKDESKPKAESCCATETKKGCCSK